MNPISPIPKQPISVRAATPADLAFVDPLQKANHKAVGFMPSKQLEGKIAAGAVLIAECDAQAVGYIIAHDRYFKHDDVGIIYQVNVAPGHRRGLVGAALVTAAFERAAYGCRLFCCWCAQDLPEANRFWEALGFVPLAFRAGSRGKGRVHIFWQRRIRAGDVTTPWWFPSQTSAGSIREDRLVLPIPPGRHWSDEMPVILPADDGPAALPQSSGGRKKAEPAKATRPKVPTLGGALYFTPPATPPPPVLPAARMKPAKVKNDPKLVAAARELRDRWLEGVNAGRYLPAAEGKYDVSRDIADPAAATEPALLLDATLIPALPPPVSSSAPPVEAQPVRKAA